MAAAQFASALPQGPGAGFFETVGNSAVGIPQAQADAAHQQTYNNSVFSQRTMPQLNSSIAANGQYYSTNRQQSDKFATQDFMKQSGDLASQMQRQIDDLVRQQGYATMGLLF